MLRMSRSHREGGSLILNVHDVTNPFSLRPTASFTDMQFTESDRKDVVSNYDKQIVLATSKMAKIDPSSAGIIQSNYDPDSNSTV